MRTAATVLPPDSTSQTPPTCRERSDRSRPCCPVSPTAAASVLTATAQSMLPILLTAAAQRTSRSRSRSARRCRPSLRSHRPRPASIPIPIQNLSRVFSPSGTAADRLEYTDSDFEALGLVENVAASPLPILVGIPNANVESGNRPITSMAASTYSTSMPAAISTLRASFRRRPGRRPISIFRSSCNGEGCLPCSSGEIAGHSHVSATGGATSTALPGADHDFGRSSAARRARPSPLPPADDPRTITFRRADFRCTEL